MPQARALLHPKRLVMAVICLCLALAGQVTADTHGGRILQGIRGDLIALDAPASFVCSHPPCPARICIQTPPTRSATALSIGESRALTRRVESGGTGCIDLAPVVHMMTFWAEDDSGQMVPVLLAPFDLRQGSGTVTWAHWLSEPPH